MGWLNEVFPDNEQWQNFSNGVISMTEKFKDSIEIGECCIIFVSSDRFIIFYFLFLDPRLKELGEERMTEWRKWFDNRLDNAIEAAEVEAQLEGGNGKKTFIFSSHHISSHSRMIDLFSPFCRTPLVAGAFQ